MNYLLPTKHSHPDKTIIAASFFLLKRLKKFRVEKYDSLLEALKKNNADGQFLFLPAINFLYLLGLIEYHSKNDSFEYIGK